MRHPASRAREHNPLIEQAEKREDRTNEEHAPLTLTAQESRVFAMAILKPPRPGRVLRRAAREYLARTVEQ
jgi:hypothetical protein